MYIVTWTVAFNPKALIATMMLGFPAHFIAGSNINSFSCISYTFIPVKNKVKLKIFAANTIFNSKLSRD